MGWEWVAEGAKWLGVGGAVILAGALGIWRAGAKKDPEWVFGWVYRQREADLMTQTKEASARADRAEARVDRLIAATDRSVKVAARRLPVVAGGAEGADGMS